MSRLTPVLRPPLILAAIAVVVALVTAAGALAWRWDEAETLGDFGPAPDFALTDQLGRPFDSRNVSGKVVVASFIYTSCQDICPLLSIRMRALQTRLREQRLLGDRVQLLSFTVDPARDTPEVLHAYAEAHDADADAWRFLSGPEPELVPMIVDGFQLGVDVLPPARNEHTGHAADATDTGYEVMHSGRFVLIDQRGRIRAYYDGTDVALDRVLRDVQSLLH